MPITINGKVYRNLEDQVKYLTDELDDLNDILAYIPVDATEQNKLATRSYVDQSVTTVSAHYLTSNIYGDNFPTKAALLTGPYYYGTVPHDPDENDYAFVNADEEHDNLPSRYVFINDEWQYQYSLQASGGVVDLTSAQTVTGVKNFSNGLITNDIQSTSPLYFGKQGYYSYSRGPLASTANGQFDLGANALKWKDLYLSGKTSYYGASYVWNVSNNGSQLITQIGTSYNGTILTDTFFGSYTDGGKDLGADGNSWKDLYLSGNIIGSYKEANEVTISGSIATAHFNMDATTVNKIKYLEIYIGSDTIVSSFMIPVAAWNMSEWTSSTSIEAQPVPVSVMFNSNGLYVAVSDTGSTSVQVFAKMI